MSNRTDRLLLIKEIINENKISSQEELAEYLNKKELHFTQATLSRDLKFLKVNKIADPDKGYIYELPDKNSEKNRAQSHAAQGFISIQFARGLGIINTEPGYANSIARLIDKNKPFEIVGTIAGDDTILIIPKDEISENDIINSLILILPELKNKIR